MKTTEESLANFGKRNMTLYATEVNLDRAVPELYDGMKPVLRRVAWSAHNFKPGEAVKSAKIVGNCFSAGTKVITRYADNSIREVPIENVKVGQFVFSNAHDVDDHGFRMVTNTFVIENQPLLHITCSDSIEVECTPEQIFYLRGIGEEILARDLKIGDELLAFSHEKRSYLYAKVLRTSPIPGLHTVYDIEVDDAHTFYANGLLSHNCIGTYHPHGDASAYGAMQTLVHQNVPILSGVGNWGTLIDPAASSRYTNALLSKIGQAIFSSEYCAVMDTVSNYDGTALEPVVLPVRLPFLVLNGADGIGVGITCKIPTFTLESVVAVLRALFSGKKLEGKDFARMLKPKQHWGGHMVESEANSAEWLRLMETGSAKISFAPDLKIDARKKIIEIFEWPAGLTPDSLLSRVRAMPECARAFNSKGALTFIIECKKFCTIAQFNEFVNKIRTLVTVSETYRFNVTHRVSNGSSYETKFLHLSVKDFFFQWCTLRLQLEKKSLEWRIKKLRSEIRFNQILVKAAKNSEIMLKALHTTHSQKALSEALSISDEDAERLLNLRIKTLSKLDQQGIRQKLEGQKSALASLLESYRHPKEKICQELDAMLLLAEEDQKIIYNRMHQKLIVK